MKVFMFVTVAAFLTAMSSAARAQTIRGSAEDRTAIKAIAGKLEAGWNRKSGVEFARPFAHDCDYVVVNGAHVKGRQKVAEGHQRIFDTVYKKSTLKTAVENIRFLTTNVAVSHVLAKLSVERSGLIETTAARITLVLKKQRTGWEIVAFQNTHITIGS